MATGCLSAVLLWLLVAALMLPDRLPLILVLLLIGALVVNRLRHSDWPLI